MISGFEILKFVHILSAIVAFGFNLTYGVLIARATREPDHRLHALQTVQALDRRFANPGYALLLATGLVMVAISAERLTDFWILGALILYTLTAIVGVVVYAPLLRKQMAALRAGRSSDAEFAVFARRVRKLGALLGLMVTAIVFLMVTKPDL